MPTDTIVTGRPYGGCAIVWNRNFKGRVDPVNFMSQRACGVVISIHSRTILLANVYMRTDTCHDLSNYAEYKSIIQEIVDMKEKP